MVCSRCGRPICSSCYKPYLDLALCPNCYHSTVPRQIPAAPPAPPVGGLGMGPHAGPPPVLPPGAVPGGILMGPYPRIPFFWRLRWVPVVLLGLAAFLILFNGVALLYSPFYTLWVAYFPWVANLGSFAFILGVVLGLVLLGTIVMVVLGFRVLAAFVVFPAAIVSLLIGGGFVFGVIIGVLAGLIILVREHRLF